MACMNCANLCDIDYSKLAVKSANGIQLVHEVGCETWCEILCDTGVESGGEFLFDADADYIGDVHAMFSASPCGASTEQFSSLVAATADGNAFISQYGDLIYAFADNNLYNGLTYETYDRKTQTILGSGTISGIASGGALITNILDSATDPTTGIIYVASYVNSIYPTEISTFDPVTGVVTYQYSIAVDSDYFTSGIAIDAAGQMYALVEDTSPVSNVVKIDKTDGTVQSTFITGLTDDPMIAMTFDYTNGNLLIQGAVGISVYDGTTGAYIGQDACITGNGTLVGLPKFVVGDTVPGTGYMPAPVRFIRCYHTDAAGNVTTSDTTLDGDAYEVAGEVVECSSDVTPAIVTTGYTVLEGAGTWNSPSGMHSVGLVVISVGDIANRPTVTTNDGTGDLFETQALTWGINSDVAPFDVDAIIVTNTDAGDIIAINWVVE